MNKKSVQFAVKFERNALHRYKISHGRIKSDSLCCEFLCESKVTTEPGRKSNKDYNSDVHLCAMRLETLYAVEKGDHIRNCLFNSQVTFTYARSAELSADCEKEGRIVCFLKYDA